MPTPPKPHPHDPAQPRPHQEPQRETQPQTQTQTQPAFQSGRSSSRPKQDSPIVLRSGETPVVAPAQARNASPQTTESTATDPLDDQTPIPSTSTPIPPRCPHFGPCGGCQLQHLPYPDQLTRKQHRLRTLLAEANLPTPSLHLHTADPWHYRNRIRLRLEPDPATPTTFLIGYNHRASNTFLPIHTCPITAPTLIRAAQALAGLPATHPDAARWLTSTAEIELFTLPDESRLQLTLHLRTAPSIPAEQQPRAFTRLCEHLQTHLAALGTTLAGAGADLLRAHHTNTSRIARRPPRSQGPFTPLTWGAPGLAYPVPLAPSTPPTPLWVSRSSFFQVNRHLLPTLVQLALHALPTEATTPPAPTLDPLPPTSTSRPEAKGRSGEAPVSAPAQTPGAPPPADASQLARQAPATQPLLWDLFAGVGLFTRALAPHATRITAVESAPASTADLAAARLPNSTILTSTVLSFLRAAVLDRDRPSFVLLDPPRAGLGLESTALLTRIAPARIVYVSCDPTSLTRDLAAMLSSGYNLAELHLVDLFPQTEHLETVAILDRIP